MEEFGCTSISCSSERQKSFLIYFWVRNILPRGLIGLSTKMAEKIKADFFTTQVTFLAEFCGSRLEPIGGFEVYLKSPSLGKNPHH